MKGRGKWHREEWQKNHGILKKILIHERRGIRKYGLYRKSGLSRRIIDKHLVAFGDKIKRDGKLLFWKSNYDLANWVDGFFDYFWDILDLQGKYWFVKRLEKLIELRFKQLDGIYEMVDKPDKIIVRERKTGKTYTFNLFFPEK